MKVELPIALGCIIPVLDLGRDPRWARIWESFGEDAIVNSRMVEAEILGYQGPNPNQSW
jgi:beta-glucosidase